MTDTFTDFDPNKQDVQPWAVYDGYRGFKLYRERRHALSAVIAKPRVKLYEHVDGRWVLHAVKDVDNLPRYCDHCGNPVHLGESRHRYDVVRQFVWDRGPDGKITSPPKLLFLHKDCKKLLGL